MTADPWSFLQVRVVNDYVEVPYRRVRKKKNGSVHLVRGECRRAICGLDLGGRREGDKRPIEARGEPTCLRCRGIARRERKRDDLTRRRHGL